jgi:hypothetical protein
MLRTLGIILLAVGCSGEDTTPPAECTEVCAEYDVTVSDQQGCDETVVLDWMEGPLQVSGEPTNLGFDFGEVAMAGSYDDNLDVFFDGIKAISDTALNEQDVVGEGVASEDEAGWTIDGTVTIQTVNGLGEDCEVTAAFLAVEET